MHRNKILVELYIPLIEKSYDLYIPINKKIGTVKKLIEIQDILEWFLHRNRKHLKICP